MIKKNLQEIMAGAGIIEYRVLMLTCQDKKKISISFFLSFSLFFFALEPPKIMVLEINFGDGNFPACYML